MGIVWGQGLKCIQLRRRHVFSLRIRNGEENPLVMPHGNERSLEKKRGAPHRCAVFGFVCRDETGDGDVFRGRSLVK